MGSYLKAPAAEVDYAVDWGASYLDGETVTVSDWIVAPGDGLRVAATTTGPRVTAATLTGGAEGRLYRVTNAVTLSDGRRDARTLTVRVDER
ncbi:MAG: hypothetical protein AAGD40_02405 [Pseudomonadota bacterium]